MWKLSVASKPQRSISERITACHSLVSRRLRGPAHVQLTELTPLRALKLALQPLASP